MRAVGDRYRAAGVRAIYLVHGTFVGTDATGLISELGRVFPSAKPALRDVVKNVVDALTGDGGNYTPAYAKRLESALARDGSERIEVRLFDWSSENHHIGRADGAVRLIDELSRMGLGPDDRILMWGHSHAGNVFALMTNLLGGDRETVEEFFEAAEVYYRLPLVGWVDVPIWQGVRQKLSGGKQAIGDAKLDLVTFGTPVRYGWETEGYAKLLHLINHRPADGLPEYRAPFPPRLERVREAADGDYVQQLGIAGTNLIPSVFSWRSWWADYRLNGLLQRELEGTTLADRVSAGVRVPDEGETLLVDYGGAASSIAKHHAGHAVYTRRKWMLFHAETVADRFYGRAA